MKLITIKLDKDDAIVNDSAGLGIKAVVLTLETGEKLRLKRKKNKRWSLRRIYTEDDTVNIPDPEDEDYGEDDLPY